MAALVVLAASGGRYVAGAYAVFLILVLAWVAIMATRIARVERELGALDDLAEKRDR